MALATVECSQTALSCSSLDVLKGTTVRAKSRNSGKRNKLPKGPRAQLLPTKLSSPGLIPVAGGVRERCSVRCGLPGEPRPITRTQGCFVETLEIWNEHG